MTWHVVRLVDCRTQPWRNGGGSTRELLAWPDKTHWQLRVSVAEIAHAGPFSAFPHVERWFAVVTGAGVSLALPQGAANIGPNDEPVRFDGEWAPHCHLLDGPTEDLNFMVQRSAGMAFMHKAGPDPISQGPVRWRGVYTADDVVLAIDGISQTLHAGSLLWSDSVDAVEWQLRHPGRAWWLSLEAP